MDIESKTRLEGLAATKDWFQKAVPSPTLQNIRVQLGVHFEEVGEMLEELSSKDPETDRILKRATAFMQILGTQLKTQPADIQIQDYEKLLDSLCDQIVTTVGVAHMTQMDILGAMDETNRSNFSKFIDGKPVFNSNGKIAKGPHYTEPDLRPFI